MTLELFKTIKKNNIFYGDDNLLLIVRFEEIICELEKEEVIEGVAKKKKWPYSDRIYSKYKLVPDASETLTDDDLKSLLSKFHPSMQLNYYFNKPNQFMEDKEDLEALNTYLIQHRDSELMSINERSYMIFKSEKFLSEKGDLLLKKVSLTIDDLNCYPTYEPFIFHAAFDKTIRSILIIENKDTFDSFKKLFIQGYSTYFGVQFEMVIYGEGKKICRSIDFLKELNLLDVNLYYYGDFDKEGFSIFNTLQMNYGKHDTLQLFKPMYLELWERKLPLYQKEQYVKREIYSKILSVFEESDEMIEFLDGNHYVPQECTNIVLLRSLSQIGNG